jgi:hypothetical protein
MVLVHQELAECRFNIYIPLSNGSNFINSVMVDDGIFLTVNNPLRVNGFAGGGNTYFKF